MRLIIAEKPSLARAIADALPTPHRRSGDSIECGRDDVVVWCAGHILEMAEPKAYHPDYQKWRLGDLPIVPRDWQLVVTSPELLRSIKTRLKSATSVVHAGDPDREGQLLVDEVLGFLGYKGPVERLLVRDLSPDAVRRALSSLQPNATYRSLTEAALARQRADWLYGINMTRLYTLLGEAGGYDGVLSVGRVQTPLLGLIVARDLAIETFRPAPYFAVHVELAQERSRICADWQPGPAHEAELDPEGRLCSKEVALAIVAKVEGALAAVTKYDSVDRRQNPPLPYSLADLQIDASKALGLSAEQTLAACQRLYETHRLATYPRSDCSYLPWAHLAQATSVLAAVAKTAPSLSGPISAADLSLCSAAWNDAKVTAHHAIIPTATAADSSKLTDTERDVYELIARRYLMQFYPVCEWTETTVELEAAGERFVAKARRTKASGWKLLQSAGTGDASDDAPKPPRSGDFPAIEVGTTLPVTSASADERKTQPPKPFTDASLITAMCAIARYVANPDLKKILHDKDGIGTPATRAAIIETLFERGYVERAKKTIRSTPTGRALIKALPEVATQPDMTAVWEAAMQAIQDGRKSLDEFLGRVSDELTELVSKGKALGKLQVAASRSAAPPPPTMRSATSPARGDHRRQRRARVRGSRRH